MNIKSLALHNFRNFAEVQEIALPDDALLVAAAPNATGKTNFLESLIMLLRGKSFRAGLDECIRWGEDHFIVRGQVARKNGVDTIAVRYHQPTRRLRIEENKAPASPITFFNHYPLIIFLPEDSFMFARGPAQRRNFFNQVLVSSPTYVTALVQYHRALLQRNAKLKSAVTPADVAVWTDLVIEYGTAVRHHRQQFVRFIAERLADAYGDIAGETRSFDVSLQDGIGSSADFREALDAAFTYEQRYGYTMHGPHRDDLAVTTDGRKVAIALSQGQMRSMVIALKLIAHAYVTSITGERPLLLCDEILSELDTTRRQALLRHLPQSQILLTCTAVPRAVEARSDVHLLDLRAILEREHTFAPEEARMQAPADQEALPVMG